MNPVKELRADGSDPLFDKTNMLYKEFPSDFRQIRYFTLLIVQSAPLEIKEINLLEQQISEVIKNAVKHGNQCDLNKKVRVWYSFSSTHAHLIVEDEGDGFKDLEKWNEFTASALNASTSRILNISDPTYHSVQTAATNRTAATRFLPRLSTGTAVSFLTTNGTELPFSRNTHSAATAFQLTVNNIKAA